MTTVDVKHIVEVAQQAAIPNELEPGGLYAVVVPEGYSAEVIDDRENDDRRAAAPRRRRGTTRLTRRESFSLFVQKNRDAAQDPALYANDDAHSITAVFNGSTADGPGWADDRATLDLVFTPEWKAWTGKDGEQLNQVKFAEFLEDHRTDVVDPDGATLLEMVQAFEATVGVEFKSAQRLRDGQRQISYVETVQGRTSGGSAGTVEFPATFLLKIPVFDGLEPVEVGARIRYRIQAGSLTIGYVLDDTDKLAREAFDAILAAVEDDTGLMAYHGSPA